MILTQIIAFKQNAFAQIFTIYLRYLIGGAFVLAALGMGKFSGNLPPDKESYPLDSIENMFQTFRYAGVYFLIGCMQILAGFLLLTQRFAILGAVIFFPIIVGIFVITMSYNFGITRIITGLMLLANVYLLLWDFKTLRYVFLIPKHIEPYHSLLPDCGNQPYWIVTGLIIFLTLIILNFVSPSPIPVFLIWFSEGLLALFIYIASGRCPHRPSMR